MYTGISFLGSLADSVLSVVSTAVCFPAVVSTGSYSSGFISRSGSEPVSDSASSSTCVSACHLHLQGRRQRYSRYGHGNTGF